MIRMNRFSVSMVIGRVSIISIGCMMVLMNFRISVVSRVELKLLICIECIR